MNNNKVMEAKELFAQGFNCAQAVSAVFAKEYGLEQSKVLMMATGFGGGMRQGEVCGAVSGAIMVIGFKYGFNNSTDKEKKDLCYGKTVEFMEAFKAKNNSIICKKLLGYDISCEQGMKDAKNKNLFTTTCVDMITDAVMILEKLGY